jgi:hypothetical protein
LRSGGSCPTVRSNLRSGIFQLQIDGGQASPLARMQDAQRAVSRRFKQGRRPRWVAPSWEQSRALSFGPVIVRRQTSLEAACRRPKKASHLYRIEPMERFRPVRNDPAELTPMTGPKQSAA